MTRKNIFVVKGNAMLKTMKAAGFFLSLMGFFHVSSAFLAFLNSHTPSLYIIKDLCKQAPTQDHKSCMSPV